MLEWFKELDWQRKAVFGVLFCIFLYYTYVYMAINLRFKYAKTYQDCGIFLRYEDIYQQIGRGTPWYDRWIVVENKYKKVYRFLYLNKRHKHIDFLKNGLKEGETVCFNYFNVWVKTHGKTSLKSIERKESK